jgi:hypothetical protein
MYSSLMINSASRWLLLSEYIVMQSPLNAKLSDNIEINLLRHGTLIFHNESHFKLYTSMHKFPALSRNRNTEDGVATGCSVVQIPAGTKEFSLLQNHLQWLCGPPRGKAAVS